MLRWVHAVVVWTLVASPLVATGALGFSFFPGHSGLIDDEIIAILPQWRDGSGLEDGIQVGVDSAIAADLGAQTPAEVALVEQAIVAGFRGWGNGALAFDITFGTSATRDPMTGFEIDLLAAPQSDPIFSGTSGFFGIVDQYLVNDFLPSVGVFDTLLGGDIYLNTDLLSAIRPLLTQQEQLDALTRLVMHEVGHAIGLGHPNGITGNFDTDLDPFNVMPIDPTQAGHNLIWSPNIDPQAIMTPRPCGAPVLICPATFFTTLRNDDIGGRDALYPVVVPEAHLSALLAAAAAIGLVWRSVPRYLHGGQGQTGDDSF